MKALILYEDSGLDRYVKIIIRNLKRRNFYVSVKNVSKTDLKYCKGCFSCWYKTPGVCVIDERADRINEEIIGSDLLVFLSRISFGGYHSTMKKTFEHLLPIILPQVENGQYLTRHIKRYKKYPVFLGVGVMAGNNNTEARIFEALVKKNSYNINVDNSGAVVINKKKSIFRISADIESGLRLLLK